MEAGNFTVSINRREWGIPEGAQLQVELRDNEPYSIVIKTRHVASRSLEDLEALMFAIQIEDEIGLRMTSKVQSGRKSGNS
jgi:hypothetical protein